MFQRSLVDAVNCLSAEYLTHNSWERVFDLNRNLNSNKKWAPCPVANWNSQLSLVVSRKLLRGLKWLIPTLVWMSVFTPLGSWILSKQCTYYWHLYRSKWLSRRTCCFSKFHDSFQITRVTLPRRFNLSWEVLSVRAGPVVIVISIKIVETNIYEGQSKIIFSGRVIFWTL